MFFVKLTDDEGKKVSILAGSDGKIKPKINNFFIFVWAATKTLELFHDNKLPNLLTYNKLLLSDELSYFDRQEGVSEINACYQFIVNFFTNPKLNFHKFLIEIKVSIYTSCNSDIK